MTVVTAAVTGPAFFADVLFVPGFRGAAFARVPLLAFLPRFAPPFIVFFAIDSSSPLHSTRAGAFPASPGLSSRRRAL